MQLATTIPRPTGGNPEASTRLGRFEALLPSMTTDALARPRAPPTPATSAVDRMAREHYEPLLRFALRLSGSEAEARDLVQDTFERALRRETSFEPGTNERAWLHSILHHAFLDRCRRAAVRKTVGDEELECEPAEAEAPAPRWASISADQLGVAIASLDDDLQRVYRMHALEQRSYKAIADALAIPMNTVGTRLARARQKLKTLLVAMSGGPEEEDDP